MEAERGRERERPSSSSLGGRLAAEKNAWLPFLLGSADANKGPSRGKAESEERLEIEWEKIVVS